MLIKKINTFFNFQAKDNSFKEINVGDYILKASADCKLDEYLINFKNYSRNLAQLIRIVSHSKPNELIIDIGANIGDTVALIRTENIQNPILCIEGNKIFFDLLKYNVNQFEDVEIINVFLSNDHRGFNGTVITQDGTAKIIESKSDLIETVSLNKLFRDCNRPKVNVLKIDTDGFDILILEGSDEIIRKDLPVIFFEYDVRLNISKQSCLSYLISLLKYEYSNVIFFDNYGNFLVSAELSNDKLLSQLDRYIIDGAFPYYDVAVFNSKDGVIFEKVLNYFNQH